jgi:hypothetical protein
MYRPEEAGLWVMTVPGTPGNARDPARAAPPAGPRQPIPPIAEAALVIAQAPNRRRLKRNPGTRSMSGADPSVLENRFMAGRR